MRAKGPGQKGTFGNLRLSVATKYIWPVFRNKVLLAVALLGAGVLLLAALDLVTRRGRLVSNGPLSSNHASFEGSCSSCHDPFRSVSDQKCSLCHEKHGDTLGVYTFAAHYLYRSTDSTRLAQSANEMPCISCHIEHEGREAEITQPPDRKCLSCHPYGSFNEKHPEFDFVAQALPDIATLSFAHAQHVGEVMKQEEVADVERTCLYCHNARADGRNFEEIRFDRHCAVCHLTASAATPRVAADLPNGASRPGVETLEEIQDRGGLGTRWALFSNPREFRRIEGGRLRKLPVHHADPWVLANLRRLRRELSGDAPLADLLVSSGDTVPQPRVLYAEAIATLELYAAELSARPQREIQRDLDRVRRELARLGRRLDDPLTPLDPERFRVPAANSGRGAEIVAVVDELTRPCRDCHQVEAATIARVQKDQRVLDRAEFDHRAHILQAGCLDCHAEIPILQLLEASDPVDPSRDRAEIQNLPAIASCQRCHTESAASNRCVTCHYFHPNKSRRSDLLLYLE